jgi:hypothetical protein
MNTSAMPSEDENELFQCPCCDGAMKVVRIIPRHGELPELRSYRCVECDEVVTLEN